MKTNPPSHVRAMSEDSFPTSLLIHWTHPVPDAYIPLIYEIRFCAQGSSTWDYVSLVVFLPQWTLWDGCFSGFCKISSFETRTWSSSTPPPQVPFQDTAKSIESFRLQNLQADTLYTTQVRCQYSKDGQYWSDWSRNVTKRTPEDREFCHQVHDQEEKQNKRVCLETFFNMYSVYLCTD